MALAADLKESQSSGRLNKDSVLRFLGATNDPNPPTPASTKRGTQWLKESKDRSKNQTARM